MEAALRTGIVVRADVLKFVLQKTQPLQGSMAYLARLIGRCT